MYLEKANPHFLEGSVIEFQKIEHKRHNLLYNVLRCGHIYCGEKYFFSRRGLDSYAMLYVQSGTALLEFGNEVYHVSEGDFLFFDQSQQHEFRSKCSHLEFTFAYIFGSNVRHFWEIFYNSHRCLLQNYDPKLYLDTADQIMQLLRDEKQDPFKISALIYTLLADLLRYCDLEHDNYWDVSKAIEYLQQHYTEKFSLDELANSMYMDKYTLIRQFRARTCQTPQEFHTNLRFRKSKTLLKNTDLSVSEIARQVGFPDSKGLTALFKKKIKITPTQYREEDLEEFFERRDRLRDLEKHSDSDRSHP